MTILDFSWFYMEDVYARKCAKESKVTFTKQKNLSKSDEHTQHNQSKDQKKDYT